MKSAMALLFALATICLVSGCEGKMAKMSNQELAEKRDECVRSNPTSPGKVTACENIRKECEKRRKNGVYAC